MTKQEISTIRKHLEAIAACAECESIQDHAQHAINLLREQKGNSASAENGKKGGRPRKQYTAEQIRKGMIANGTTRFVISEEGDVFRQNHNHNYICVGHTDADEERRAALLVALRTAKRTGASEKEAAAIVKDFA